MYQKWQILSHTEFALPEHNAHLDELSILPILLEARHLSFVSSMIFSLFFSVCVPVPFFSC
jgi:hypothetical protein